MDVAREADEALDPNRASLFLAAIERIAEGRAELGPLGEQLLLGVGEAAFVLREFLFLALERRDVREHADRADLVALRVVDRRGVVVAVHRLAVGNYAAFQPSELVIINAAANNTDRQFIEANQKTYFGTPAGL